MRKLFAIGLFFIAFSGTAQTETVDPYELVKQVNKAVFKRLSAEQELIKQDVEYLRVIIQEELLPHIDYKYSAYKVIGKNIKNTSKDQRSRFVLAFKDYLVQTYAQVLGQYDDQKLSFEPGKPYSDRNVVAARVTIIDGQRPPIKVDFKLRKNKKTKEWKAFDMIAEGISLLSSKQSELGPLIRKQGIDAVTERLREKNAQPLVIEKRI